jgi:thiamine pyrophosphokinase
VAIVINDMLLHVGLNGTITRARCRVQRSERYLIFRCMYISYLHISGLQYRLDDARLIFQERVSVWCVTDVCSSYCVKRASASNMRYLSILAAAFWGHADATQ